MKIGIFLPIAVYFEAEGIEKIVAEGREGYFTLQPRHIDYVSVLVPGILTVTGRDWESLFAVDHGTLIKQGDLVRIAARNCVRGDDPATLAAIVDKEFREIDDMERKARTALTGLEHSMMRRFAELRKG
ncbi:MAG: F0F1 ATP synthase subunit epsilon [Desulfobulbaceae bacterium]|nr:F0F1 ATP synthase subunit epsilon [Desulfobulbaceae bacterium]